MISEEYDLTGKKNNPIELTGNINPVEQLKANINIPIIHVPPVTTELEITPSDQIQIFTPPEDTFYNKVTCKATSIITNSLTITPARQEQTFTPPIGEYYNNVTCEAIPNEYIIPTGEINITNNGVYDITNYASANVNTPSPLIDWTEIGYTSEPQSIIDGFNYAKTIQENWDSTLTSKSFLNDYNLTFFPNVDTSNFNNFYNMFNSCKSLIKVPKLNYESTTNIAYCFYNCSSLKEIGDIDNKVNNGTVNMSYAFDSCSSLETAPMIITKRRVNMNNLFYNCANLKNVPQFNLSTNDGYMTIPTNMFSNCPKLTNESLNNIMGIFAYIPVTTGNKTLRSIGFSSEQATTCTTLSNWSALQSAGWTTGY